MAYTEEEKEKILNDVFRIIEDGKSLRKALKEVNISSSTFFIWIDEDEEKSKQYARAIELRAEFYEDEMMDIVDSTEADVHKDDNGNVKIDGNVVQRARLQYDARKWLMGKLNPKKYGDSVDLTSKGKRIDTSPREIILNVITPTETD